MYYFKKILICALVLLPLTHTADLYAQDKERLEAARTLVVESGAIEACVVACNMMAVSIMKNIFEANPKTAPYSLVLTNAMAEVLEESLNEPQTREDLKTLFASVYVEEFTTDELKEITSFYKTNTGKKCLQKMPSIMQKSQQKADQFAQKLLSETMKQKVKTKIKQLQNEGIIPAKL